MPKKRQPREIWLQTRKRILQRDNFKCVRCKIHLEESSAHIDHIKSGKLSNNHDSNLRTLCRKCHTLRLDHRHRGMISKALKLGIIDADWRDHLWE